MSIQKASGLDVLYPETIVEELYLLFRKRGLKGHLQSMVKTSHSKGRKKVYHAHFLMQEGETKEKIAAVLGISLNSNRLVIIPRREDVLDPNIPIKGKTTNLIFNIKVVCPFCGYHDEGMQQNHRCPSCDIILE